MLLPFGRLALYVLSRWIQACRGSALLSSVMGKSLGVIIIDKEASVVENRNPAWTCPEQGKVQFSSNISSVCISVVDVIHGGDVKAGLKLF